MRRWSDVVMMQVIWKHKKWFGYFFYGLLLTMSLLYYRFPSDAIRDHLKATFLRINPQMVLAIGKVFPFFPFGMKWTDTQLSFKEEPGTLLFRANNVFIRPHLWSYMKGQANFLFKCQAYGGTLRGHVHFLKNSFEAPFNTSITMKNIRIDKDTLFPNIFDGHVEGVLEGTIKYSGQNNLLRQGSGEVNLRILDGNTDLLQSVLSLESVDFKEFFIKMILKNQIIDMTNTELKGASMNGMVSGFISLKEEFSKSSLDLRITIEPFVNLIKSLEKDGDSFQSFKQRLKRGKLSFVIRGTVGDPSIQFI